MLKSLFSLVNKMMKRKLDPQIIPEIEVPEKVKKMRRRNYIILMMYNGKNYYGMQRLKDFPSIEEELLKAMLNADLITEMNFEKLPSIRFQRCSKTDRSVSALGQLVSAYLNEEIDNKTNILNQYLPDDIQVLDVFRATKNFNAKSLCESREYVYYMPSFALSGQLKKSEEELSLFRLTAERLSEFNKILSNYIGTKFYYNFTSGRSSNDQSCNRYITIMECSDPFLINEREFVCITVHGQSFMLHQIRKMIGLAIAVVTCQVEKNIYSQVFQSTRLDIPKAPGLGLVLSQVFFSNYNNRHCSNDEHKAISFENYRDKIDSFKSKNILPYIVQKEIEEKVMYSWLNTLPLHTYDTRDHESIILKIKPEVIDTVAAS